MERLTDSDLVVLLKKGEALAFEEFLRRYGRKVYSLARSLTRNEADAQDALQETFLSIFRKIKGFKETSSLSTWVYRIAINAALMQVRRRKKDDRTVPIDDYLPRFDDSGHLIAGLGERPPRGDEELLRKELAEFLRESIGALDPDSRAVFILRDQEGLTNEDVARILGQSVPAVKSRLHRARLFLRGRIERYRHGTDGGRRAAAAGA
jgi:RNA polymerase sigma-70 factor (ECF subfamily)